MTLKSASKVGHSGYPPHPTWILVVLVCWGVLIRMAVAVPIDLDHPPNYANQPRPDYIQRDNTTPGNEITDLGATLGRVLFHDRKLSVNDSISCASCHDQTRAFTDPAIASEGVNGFTDRTSMRLVNIRFAEEGRAFWDKRAGTIEDQATMPIRDHIEMGFSGHDGAPDFDDLIEKMVGIPYYPFLFERVFGDPEITEDRMQRALAQFVRSIESFDSPYDVGRAQVASDHVPFPSFTPAENRGKSLFLQSPVFDEQGFRIAGGAGCAECHRPPEFDIDPASLSNAVFHSIFGGRDLGNTRSPSLRDVVSEHGTPHSSFMHDASRPSLITVINHYNMIPRGAASPGNRRFIDPRLLPGGYPQRLQLTIQERNDLVDFLRTLTGTNIYTDPKWSNPFDGVGNLMIVQMDEGAVK